MPEWAAEEGYVQNGEVRLHYYAAGPAEGEPVLLLHGFPQFSYEWRYHLPRLAAEGYRVIAPDLRGYNLSDHPLEVQAYGMQKLMSDITAFYREFGWQAANLVAHDWGGAVAWPFAIFNPQLVRRFVVIDMPHPTAFRMVMQTPVQIQRSFYIWFFQTLDIPERVYGQNPDAFLRHIMYGTAKPGTFSDEDYAIYLEHFSRPGQLGAMMNYYRANMNPAVLFSENPPQLPPLQIPVTLIYGQRDVAFAPSVWAETAKYCVGPYRAVELPGVGHWAVEEAPAETLELILEQLKQMV